MGIPGLWKVLAAISRKRSLTEFTVREGWETRRHTTGALIIAVDASPWMYEAQGAIESVRRKGAARASLGKNAELRLLFDRVAGLAYLPIIIVFVFDGAKRPSEKRNTAVGAAEHYLAQDFKKIIQNFGFYSHDAPGEAEAEMAYLDKSGAFDMVMTSDSDIFLFGGTHVIRSPQDPSDRDCVDIYIVEAGGPEFLNPASLLFLAIMLGGDYNPAGLKGCGMTKALPLSTTNLAHSIYDATLSLPEHELEAFLIGWCEDLKDALSLNPNDILGARYPSLAASIPEDFPDPSVLQLYANPITSENDPDFKPDTATWVSKLPDTAALAAVCQQLFGWDNILDRFLTKVWNGQCVRELAMAHCKLPTTRNTGLGVNSIRHIHKTGIKINSPTAFASYDVEVWLPSVTPVALIATGTSRGAGTHESGNAWVPGPILRSAAAGLVDEYHRVSGKPRLDKHELYVPILRGDESQKLPKATSDGVKNNSDCSEWGDVIEIDDSSDEEGGMASERSQQVLDLTGHASHGSEEREVLEIIEVDSDNDDNDLYSSPGHVVIDLTGDED